jgi:hypothetical protein
VKNTQNKTFSFCFTQDLLFIFLSTRTLSFLIRAAHGHAHCAQIPPLKKGVRGILSKIPQNCNLIFLRLSFGTLKKNI